MSPQDQLAQWIRQYGDRAYNFAYRLCGNAPDASDLVQEAFFRIWKHWKDYDPDRPFHSWLFQIMNNIFLDTLKRADRKNISLDQTLVSETGGEERLAARDLAAGDRLEKLDEESVLQTALNRLPLPYRAAVVMRDIEQLSYEEMARILEVPIGTIRSRIFEGRKQLRDAYEQLQRKGGVRS